MLFQHGEIAGHTLESDCLSRDQLRYVCMRALGASLFLFKWVSPQISVESKGNDATIEMTCIVDGTRTANHRDLLQLLLAQRECWVNLMLSVSPTTEVLYIIPPFPITHSEHNHTFMCHMKSHVLYLSLGLLRSK